MPRKPKPTAMQKLLARAKEFQTVIIGGATALGILVGGIVWGGSLFSSDHPPLASVKRVEQLAQSQTEILKHESVTDHELLELRLRECKRDRTDAEIALAIHPDSRTDKNAQDDATDCIHTLGKLLTKPNS